MTSLFESKTAADELFNSMATPSNEHVFKAKLFAEKMWDCCREYIDPNAEQAKTVNFYPILVGALPSLCSYKSWHIADS